MAFTVGTVIPIAPASLSTGGMRQSACIMGFPVLAAQAYRIGDIVSLVGGLADAIDAAQGDGTILGVTMAAKPAIAAPLFSDQILLACALPGAMFAGSLGTGAATDFVANTAASIGTGAVIGYDTILGTDAYSLFLHIDQADVTGGQCRPIRYSDAQLRGQTFVFASTTIINPRVDFCFRSSVFQPTV